MKPGSATPTPAFPSCGTTTVGAGGVSATTVRAEVCLRLLLEPEVRLRTTVGGKAIILFLKQVDKKIT